MNQNLSVDCCTCLWRLYCLIVKELFFIFSKSFVTLRFVKGRAHGNASSWIRSKANKLQQSVESVLGRTQLCLETYLAVQICHFLPQRRAEATGRGKCQRSANEVGETRSNRNPTCRKFLRCRRVCKISMYFCRSMPNCNVFDHYFSVVTIRNIDCVAMERYFACYSWTTRSWRVHKLLLASMDTWERMAPERILMKKWRN